MSLIGFNWRSEEYQALLAHMWSFELEHLEDDVEPCGYISPFGISEEVRGETLFWIS